MPTIAEDRPPYVRFETRALEDRSASIESGAYVAKDVDFALITPVGSKDTIERNVSEWFEQLSLQVQQERFKQEWLLRYKESYSAWKAGQAVPLHGHAVVNWPGVSPAQLKTLQAAHVLTVEDLAAANEETIARLGMGGRALKQRAEAWLKSVVDVGAVAEQSAALAVANAELTKQNKDLTARVAQLEAQLVPKKL
jgi:hypothetical protein